MPLRAFKSLANEAWTISAARFSTVSPVSLEATSAGPLLLRHTSRPAMDEAARSRTRRRSPTQGSSYRHEGLVNCIKTKLFRPYKDLDRPIMTHNFT